MISVKRNGILKLAMTGAMACTLLFACGASDSSDNYVALAPLPEVEKQDPNQVELGKWLFFDNRMSGDADRSCSNCHIPGQGWASNLPLSQGYVGTEYFRNVKTVVNAVHGKYFYWDGRLDGSDMPTQVRDSMTESHFMAGDGRTMHQRFKNIPEYVEMFDKAFGGEPSFGRVLNAVAAFERTLVSKNVPFDNYLKGNQGAISAEAKKGLKLFKGKAGCIQCHNGAMLSDYDAHKTGVPNNPAMFTDVKRHITFRSVMSFLGVPNYKNLQEDPGFYAVTKNQEDFGRFVTPTLREVSTTAPYMHNGMLASLEDVIDFYNRGGGDSSELRSLGLSSGEKKSLLAFLETLSGDPIEINIAKEDLPKYQIIDDWYNTPN